MARLLPHASLGKNSPTFDWISCLSPPFHSLVMRPNHAQGKERQRQIKWTDGNVIMGTCSLTTIEVRGARVGIDAIAMHVLGACILELLTNVSTGEPCLPRRSSMKITLALCLGLYSLSTSSSSKPTDEYSRIRTARHCTSISLSRISRGVDLAHFPLHRVSQLPNFPTSLAK
ncbi:hypothetical protein ACMFMG_001557 [Clarireedia jacksonii]